MSKEIIYWTGVFIIMLRAQTKKQNFEKYFYMHKWNINLW
jgi:hypothetical protein